MLKQGYALGAGLLGDFNISNSADVLETRGAVKHRDDGRMLQQNVMSEV